MYVCICIIYIIPVHYNVISSGKPRTYISNSVNTVAADDLAKPITSRYKEPGHQQLQYQPGFPSLIHTWYANIDYATDFGLL